MRRKESLDPGVGPREWDSDVKTRARVRVYFPPQILEGRLYEFLPQTSSESVFSLEEHMRIDIHYLKRNGFLTPGSSGLLTWSCGGEESGSASVRANERMIILSFAVAHDGCDPQTVEQPIDLEYTRCHLGGRRPWFRCGCGTRVGVLAFANMRFACRHCCGLRYGCQSESKSDRAAPKLRKIQQRVPPDGQTLCFERLRQRLDSGAIFGCIREKDVRHRVALRAFGNDRCAETDRSSHLPLFSRTNRVAPPRHNRVAVHFPPVADQKSSRRLGVGGYP